MEIPKTCDEMRELIGGFLKRGDKEASRLWTIITAQRGPDSPSERADMNEAERAKAYGGRRRRKADTVEVVRAQSFGGVVGGAARSRKDRKYLTLPPASQWDHFDRHMSQVAEVLGLKVRTLEEEKGKVKVNVKDPEKCEITGMGTGMGKANMLKKSLGNSLGPGFIQLAKILGAKKTAEGKGKLGWSDLFTHDQVKWLEDNGYSDCMCDSCLPATVGALSHAGMLSGNAKYPPPKPEAEKKYGKALYEDGKNNLPTYSPAKITADVLKKLNAVQALQEDDGGDKF
jgi:hypothetical protein